MNAREILLKAADHIERYPSSYSFPQTEIPTFYRREGCLIGWMAHYAGVHSWFGFNMAAGLTCEKLIGVRDGVFFGRLHEFAILWPKYPTAAAAALRGYADKYHPDAYTQFRNNLSLEPIEAEYELVSETTSVQALHSIESR